MHDPRTRSPEGQHANPSDPGIPDSQARALDRRHALNEQQRTFRNAVPHPHFRRPRPPG